MNRHFDASILCALLLTAGLSSTAGSLRADPPPNTSGAIVPKAPSFTKNEPAAYGLQLAEYMDRYDTGWKDQYSKSRMTLFDARGDSVVRAVTQTILERKAGDKSIVKFLSPAEIKGVAALTHENPKATDDNWLYLPATKRVRRISGANKTASFQGTEFTYEDLSSLIVRKYDWRYIEDGEVEKDGAKQPVYRLEAKPNYKDTGYSRLVVSVHQTHWRIEQIEFFDKSQRPLKRLTNSNWKLRHGRFWRPELVEMRNQQTKKRTTIQTELILLNLSLYKNPRTGKPRSNLSDAHFTTRAIEGR